MQKRTVWPKFGPELSLSFACVCIMHACDLGAEVSPPLLKLDTSGSVLGKLVKKGGFCGESHAGVAAAITSVSGACSNHTHYCRFCALPCAVAAAVWGLMLSTGSLHRPCTASQTDCLALALMLCCFMCPTHTCTLAPPWSGPKEGNAGVEPKSTCWQSS